MSPKQGESISALTLQNTSCQIEGSSEGKQKVEKSSILTELTKIREFSCMYLLGHHNEESDTFANIKNGPLYPAVLTKLFLNSLNFLTPPLQEFSPQ